MGIECPINFVFCLVVFAATATPVDLPIVGEKLFLCALGLGTAGNDCLGGAAAIFGAT